MSGRYAELTLILTAVALAGFGVFTFMSAQNNAAESVTAPNPAVAPVAAVPPEAAVADFPPGTTAEGSDAIVGDLEASGVSPAIARVLATSGESARLERATLEESLSPAVVEVLFYYGAVLQVPEQTDDPLAVTRGAR